MGWKYQAVTAALEEKRKEKAKLRYNKKKKLMVRGGIPKNGGGTRGGALKPPLMWAFWKLPQGAQRCLGGLLITGPWGGALAAHPSLGALGPPLTPSPHFRACGAGPSATWRGRRRRSRLCCASTGCCSE